jgi:hypothetical protein
MIIHTTTPISTVPPRATFATAAGRIFLGPTVGQGACLARPRTADAVVRTGTTASIVRTRPHRRHLILRPTCCSSAMYFSPQQCKVITFSPHPSWGILALLRHRSGQKTW